MKQLTTLLLCLFAIVAFCQTSPTSYFYPLNGNLDNMNGEQVSFTNPPLTSGPARNGQPHCALQVNADQSPRLPAPFKMFNTDTFSLSFWFKATSSLGRILELRFSSQMPGKCIERFYSLIELNKEDSIRLYTNDRFKVMPQSWNHVVLSYSNGNYNFYINGKKEASDSVLIYPHGFGLCPYPSIEELTRLFTIREGLIDDLWHFNYVLSSMQVSELYQSTTSCSLPTSLEDFEHTVASAITLSPNPSNGSFQITTSSTLLQYEVFNAQGKSIRKGNESYVDQLTPGIYYIAVTTSEGIQKKQIVVH